MANWTFKVSTFTPVVVADATNFTDAGHLSLQGGSSTQRIKIKEIYMGGQEPSTSSPCIMLLSRDSTVGATLTSLSTGNSNSAQDPATAALAAPTVGFVASTTKPQRSATLSLANLSFNALGGIVRYRLPIGDEFIVLGNTASFGEVSLSAYTGSTVAPMGAHIMYEPL